MKQLLITIVLCVGCITAADAQSTFTERLQKSNTGEGKISVTQDKSIDALSKDKEKVAPKDNESVVEIPDTIDMHKKVMKGYKINGYRVQVFAGGNSRNDRLKAERAGENIKSAMPGIPVYVHFYSPRWICRIGNYRKITVQYP